MQVLVDKYIRNISTINHDLLLHRNSYKENSGIHQKHSRYYTHATCWRDITCAWHKMYLSGANFPYPQTRPQLILVKVIWRKPSKLNLCSRQHLRSSSSSLTTAFGASRDIPLHFEKECGGRTHFTVLSCHKTLSLKNTATYTTPLFVPFRWYDRRWWCSWYVCN